MTDSRFDGDPDESVRRLAAFEATQDPAVLWPGLTERARVAAARELERVTRLVLAGKTDVPIAVGGSTDAYALGVAGHTTGMGPVIGRWVEDRRLAADATVRGVFADHLAHSRARNERMQQEVLPAIDALVDVGITPIVLKGFHTGRVYFDEPGARRMGDIDLLVPPARVADAEQVLSSIGFHPDSPVLKPYKRDWIGPGVDPRLFSVELSHARSKWVLEMHASIDRIYHPGAVARLDPERSGVEPIDIAGRRLLALTPPLLLVYLACHCSQELDGTRLLRVFEMARVIIRDNSLNGFDWGAALEILRRTGAARFAYPALALVEDLVPGSVDERVLQLGKLTSTWAARHTVARLAPAGGSLDDRGVLRQLMWTRSPLSIAQRIMRNLWPASFERPSDVIPGWRIRLRRLSAGVMSFRAPDERK